MGILSEEGIKDLEDRLGIQFSIEEQKQLTEQVRMVTLPKECLVLKEGDISRNLYFI